MSTIVMEECVFGANLRHAITREIAWPQLKVTVAKLWFGAA